MSRKVTLEEWLTGVINDPDREEGKGVTAFVCHHMIAGGKRGEFIHKMPRGSGEWDIKKIAEVFNAKAAISVQEKPGKQIFRVLPFFANAGEPEGYFEFSKEREEEGIGTLTEEPNERGLTAQQMRHNEAMGAMYISGMNQLMSHALDHSRQLSQENTSLRADLHGREDLIVRLSLEMESRAHELQMKAIRFERETIFFKKAAELAGPLMNTISGREIVPQNVADTQMFEALVMHMAEQKEGTGSGAGMEAFFSSLPQQLQVVIMARAAEVMRKKREEKEEIRKMNPFADPAADAAGEVADRTFMNGHANGTTQAA